MQPVNVPRADRARTKLECLALAGAHDVLECRIGEANVVVRRGRERNGARRSAQDSIVRRRYEIHSGRTVGDCFDRDEAAIATIGEANYGRGVADVDRRGPTVRVAHDGERGATGSRDDSSW